MKPAAREARPPPRWPGLRWALPPLLLLLLRLGQIPCAGAVPGPVSDFRVTSVSTREVSLAWSSDGSNSSFRLSIIQDGAGLLRVENTTDQNITIRGLDPGTNYVFEIVAQRPNGTEADPQNVSCTTEPSPVFDVEVASVSPTSVILTWKNNDTAASEYTYRIKNERDNEWAVTDKNQTRCNITGLSPASSYGFSIYSVIGNKTGRHPVLINVTTDLKSGFEPRVAWRVPEPNETQNDPVLSEGGPEANSTDRPLGESLPSPRSSPTASVTVEYLEPVDPSDVKVLLLGLESSTLYNATVFPQAADGTEGQSQDVKFKTHFIQVFDMEVANISATSMTLTWNVSHNGSYSAYTYTVHVASAMESFSVTVNDTRAVISGLSSSTLYNITVCPFLGDTAGTPGSLQVYTLPSPVSDFRVTSVGMREVSLAWSSNDSESFKLSIIRDGAGLLWVENTTDQNITIRGLNPGTNYVFEIVAQGPNGTEGDPQDVSCTTVRSAVSDIRVVDVTTTEIRLEWQNTDNASDYIYHVLLQSQHGFNGTNTSHKAITLGGLVPGTLYNITISPKASHAQGDPGSISQYTRPSSVSKIEISINTTAVTLTWENLDAASATYSYRLVIEEVESSSNTTQIVKTVEVTSATITELIPGSSYTVEIFTQVGNLTESSTPGTESFCTDAAPVAAVHCEVVPKKPALVLKWACPPGINKGFELEVSSDAWKNVTHLEGCSSENDTEYRKEVTSLNFSASYNISVTTLSCGKMALATQNTCTTGITDPPAPDGSPNITSVSHNSVKVKFSGFEASHGPIKAYAIILTTGAAGPPSTDVLKYTYDDFKKGASDTYVTYLIRTDERGRSQGLSEVLKYEIDVGNESMTLGYYNGKLEPLGSYRACVAGFTNITFIPHHEGLIDGAESYVSFSRYSDAVFLPQDPGVICGAVFGCIFGALVIVAVGGFIFWRKKRKDAKNNEVSFSQIKPKKSKLIRVENFEAYFKKQQADSNCGFAEEYEDLKLVGISLPKIAAELAENRGKNRYNNVLPYDSSRVKLSVQTHSTDDYINANYMPGYHSKRDFIATQGPLPNTLKDFWRMVWEKNVYAIVMLTKCVEQGRTKCEEYWPSKQVQDYGDITVAMTTEIVLPEWTVRDFTVKNIQTSESHALRQFHFTSWPDHGVPDTTDLLINFRYLVRDYMKQSPPESPILVHCSAGVGRTGTFIAIDRLIYQIENENTVDVYGIVYDLRMHRPLMVQTEDQYVFLNQCVLDIIRSQKDSKVDLIYQNTTAMTIYENLAPVSTCGKTNGYIA
ncbi:receptor-type tyrosine-protein phosphatase eta isoform X3 [Ochotona curzoniae]|uniref:receptor-type tyrosine-protein phosphatase eta isoform X3 n=1 Tax=Ochotona curzoniae TaxID=130825 RepID=UPI001B34C839|nr:receptor-type tyrosine-protein phosphatase eta isoform X3 [Ochotona curzoniae]